ncbi:hypothetical protein HN588_16350 [Candidatus Bathyarchaeota archaeon]|nr:hypothetical protein [Candidatus Bathyarchaeota archaeon]
MAKKVRRKKTLIGALKGMIGGGKSGKTVRSSRSSDPNGNDSAMIDPRRDLLASFQASTLDLDPLVHPTKHQHPPIPEIIHPGTLMMSQRHGVKCIPLEAIEAVDIQILKEICLRKSALENLAYLPMGMTVLKDEILHQGRQFSVRLRKGTLFLSPGGHANAYLLDAIALPLTRELSSNPEILLLTETTAKRHLQKLVEIPSSFSLIKEDLFYDESVKFRKVDKGTLVISRGGALSGFMLEDVHLPLKKSVADLDALFALKSTYQSLPIETLMQSAARAGAKGIPLDVGSFLFSPQGKVYFVWKEEIRATTQTLTSWAKVGQIVQDGILYISTTRSNIIGGAGIVITQDEINYLHDVFRDAGSTNIYKDTLLLDRNVFYKFTQHMPYAHTGKYRSYLRTKQIVMLNTFRKGTFSVEMGGKDIVITDLDMGQIRKHLQATGRLLIKIGTLLSIRDERHGDWVYRAVTNLFYSYETLTRQYLEEFIPESVVLDHRAEKTSTLIGPQDKPKPEDKGASGEPISDLTALINNELNNERTVFVLDGTLFHWNGRLYRVNEEMVFRHQDYSRLENQDLAGLEADWKIHPLVEETDEYEEDITVPDEEEEDLDDLPFDTSIR